MVNVAVIGTGDWGPNLVRNFYQLSNLKIVCDIDDKNLFKIQNSYSNVKVTKDSNEIFNSEDLNAVCIAVSTEHHYKLAKRSLLSGKHTFVEKPLCLSSKHSKDLIETANKQNLVLMVGHLLLYHPVVRRLKSYIEDGEFGDIQYIYSTRVNLGQVRKTEDALWEFAPHDISVILYLLDSKPDYVTAVGEAYLQPNICDVVFLTLRFPNKVMAHIHVSWLDPRKIRKMTVVGNRKMGVFDDMEPQEKLRIYDKGIDFKPSFTPYQESLALRVGDIYIPKVASGEPLKIECQHFIDCIREKKKPISDGENGLVVVKILESAGKSLKSGGKPVRSHL